MLFNFYVFCFQWYQTPLQWYWQTTKSIVIWLCRTPILTRHITNAYHWHIHQNPQGHSISSNSIWISSKVLRVIWFDEHHPLASMTQVNLTKRPRIYSTRVLSMPVGIQCPSNRYQHRGVPPSKNKAYPTQASHIHVRYRWFSVNGCCCKVRWVQNVCIAAATSAMVGEIPLIYV